MNASAPFVSVFALSRRLLAWVALLGVCCGSAVGQATAASGDYTTALPSVQRVETAIQGTDPTDTVARQVAVFEYLQVYIERIKSARDYSGPYSAGEQKLRTDYAKAQYDLTQNFTKTHSAQEVATFNHLEGNYSVNNALDWIKQLEGQQAADTYKGAETSLSQTYNQQQAKLQQQMKQDNGQSGGGLMDGLLGGGAGGDLNEDQKRCLELGGTYNECASSLMGAVSALGSLLTLGASDASANEPPPLSGVILVGAYHSRTDLPEIALTWNGNALLQKCGTLVDGTHTYTLRKSGAVTQIVVSNEPDPIVLTLRADGSLAGPGNISVKGSIISGYHNEYRCTTGTPAANCTTTSTPLYSPSMQRCTVSQLAPQPAPPPPPKATGLIGQMNGMLGGGDPVATIYGLRVIGPYASSNGMKLLFDNRYVTLDCGKAHVNAPYTVDNTATGFVIHVQNGGGAFLLAVAPDDTLRGSGLTTVSGKLVSSVQGENVSFTPHSESCNVGAFAPKGKQNTMLASKGPMPALPASDPADSSSAPEPVKAVPGAAVDSAPITASLASAGISPAPSGARAQFRVLLSSSFSGTNPLAGQAVFVSRKPMNQILRELGVTVPANGTAGQAMKALQTQCHSAQGCSSVIQGMPKYYVTTTKLDASGKATLSATAATGPYYFFAIVPDSGGSLVWDVAADLAAGDNNVAFSQANSERVR